MPDFLFFINEVLWGSIMIYLLLGAGIWLRYAVGLSVSLYSQVWQKSEKQRHAPAGRINVVSGAVYQLAARLGSGNGRALRWPSAPVGERGVLDVGHGASRNGYLFCRKFAGATLQRERQKRAVSRRSGWYMARGLGMRWMGVLFSLFTARVRSNFNTVQSNSVAHALRYTFSCPEWLTGIGLALFVLLTISAGLKGVARMMQWLVPIMALLWVAASTVVAALHADRFRA